MKFLMLILFSFLVFSLVNATPLNDKIKIGLNSITNQLEFRFTVKNKKTINATIIITDVSENLAQNFNCDIINGSPTIRIKDALNFDAASYNVLMIVHKKTYRTNFILFK